MAASVTRIYDLLRGTLDAVINYWPAAASPLPDRRYVANGTVFWDACEQVAIEPISTFGDQGDLSATLIEPRPAAAAFAMRYVLAGIWIIRCVHDMDTQGEQIIVPSAAEIEQDAESLLMDPTAVLNAIAEAIAAGELPGCGSVAFDQWDAQGPDGGYAGGVLRVRLALY
jgi:hypothetical protein